MITPIIGTGLRLAYDLLANVPDGCVQRLVGTFAPQSIKAMAWAEGVELDLTEAVFPGGTLAFEGLTNATIRGGEGAGLTVKNAVGVSLCGQRLTGQLRVIGGRDVRILNLRTTGALGLRVDGVDGLTVRRATIALSPADGMNLWSVKRVLVEDCDVFGAARSTVQTHVDAIQFGGANLAPSEDITIRRNRLTTLGQGVCNFDGTVNGLVVEDNEIRHFERWWGAANLTKGARINRNRTFLMPGAPNGSGFDGRKGGEIVEFEGNTADGVLLTRAAITS